MHIQNSSMIHSFFLYVYICIYLDEYFNNEIYTWYLFIYLKKYFECTLRKDNLHYISTWEKLIRNLP
jgi:hypothetical protein